MPHSRAFSQMRHSSEDIVLQIFKHQPFDRVVVKGQNDKN